MAGLPTFKPAPVAVAMSEADAAPATVDVAEDTTVPTPLDRPGDQAFLPMAFAPAPARTSDVDGLIAKYAAVYDVPESLVRRVVDRESDFNPGARNGQHYGLMQIRHDTAQSMGYRGSAAGLLDAETNLKYAVKYLRGAYVVGGFNSDSAMRYYARGYYYDAKRLGLLDEAGL